MPVRVARGSQRGVEVSHRAVVHASAPPAVQAGLDERLRLGGLLLEGRDAGSPRPMEISLSTAW